MKKHTIIISIILGTGIFLTCLTCTYFDPWEAGGIGEPGPDIFWIDDYGTIFRSKLHYPYFEREEIYSPPTMDSPSCIAADHNKEFFFWAATYDNGEHYRIYKSPYSNFDKIEMYQSAAWDTINSIAVHPNAPALYFSQGADLYWMPTDPPYNPISIGNYGPDFITDITIDHERNYIYFVNGTQTLYRVNMPPDGPNLASWTTQFQFIFQLAFDRTGNRIICTDSTQIYLIKEPFNQDFITVTSQGSHVLDLAVDPFEKYVYWLDLGADSPGPPYGILRTEIEESGDREEFYIFNTDGSENGEVFAIGFPDHEE